MTDILRAAFDSLRAAVIEYRWAGFAGVTALISILLFAKAHKAASLNARRLTVPEYKGSAFHIPHGLDRWDALAAFVITAAYAVVAFLGLGQTHGPESFTVFENTGDSAVIELEDRQDITRMWYFCGVRSGSYNLEVSSDGIVWTDSGEIKQEYADVLKWKEAELEILSDVKYVRLTALSTKMYLGEVALFGADGALVMISGRGPGAFLADEQSEVPESFTFKNSAYFDEIYHVRTAYEHMENLWPYEITHPPLGKIIIALGIAIFGLNPFGWRFMGVFFGVLMLPIMYVFIKRLFGRRSIACCGTIIFAFDFMHFVQTRLATIDTYAVFFILLMFYFMYIYFTQPLDTPAGKTTLPLFLSGLFFGLGAASKWTVIYGGAGLALIWLIRQIMRALWYRKTSERGFAAYLIKTVFLSLVFFIALPAAIYVSAYIPYALAKEAGIYSKEFFRIVLDNQIYMYDYHSDLVSAHPYSSVWWQWILDARPILYYLENFDDGTKSAFGAFGNPLFWWTGILAIIACVWSAVKRKNAIALFILIGFLSQLLPWVFVTRLTFAYHYFPSTVFLALAVSLMFYEIEKAWGRAGRLAAIGFTAAALVMFALFYPVLTGLRASTAYTNGWLRWFNGSYPF